MPAATNIPISATTTGFIAAFNAAQTAVSGLVRDLNTNLANSFRVADRQSRLFEQGLGRVGRGMKSLGQDLTTYVSLPLAGLGIASLKAASEMEQAGVSFRVLLKDANLAAATINDLKAFAASTPFEFNDVQSAGKQLLSYGFAVQDLKTLLTDAGNLASGFGVELGEVTRALGRIKSGDFGEAFERLRDFGIGRDVLEGKGLVFDGSGQYQGSVQKAFEAIQSIIRERFGGQMEEQSKTIGGIFSNIKDQANFALTEIGNKLVEVFNLKELGAQLVGIIGSLRDSFNGLTPGVQRTLIVAAGLATVIGPIAIAVGGAIAAFSALATAIALPLAPIAGIVAAVVGLATVVITNWDTIKTTVIQSGMWSQLTSLVRAAIDTVKAIWGVLIADITTKWNQVRGYIIPVGEFIFSTLGNIFRTAIGVLTGLFKSLTGILTGDWSKFREGLQNITASLWNGVVSLFASGINLVGSLFASFLETIGADSLSKTVQDKLSGIVSGVNGVKIALQEAQKVGKEGIQLPEVTVTAKRTISGLNKPGQLSNLAADKSGLSDAEGKARKYMSVLETIQLAQKLILEEIQTKRSLGIDIPPELFFELSKVEAQIKRIKGQTEKSVALKPLGESLVSQNLQSEGDRIALFGRKGVAGSALNDKVNGLTAALNTQRPVQTAETIAQQIREMGDRISAAYKSMRDAIKNAARDTAVEMADGMGQVIGGIVTGQVSILGGLIGLITEFISTYLSKVAQAKILAGAALVAAGAATLDPFTIAQGTRNLQAGGLLKVAASAVKVIGNSAASSANSTGKTNAFANGAVVNRPTFGVFGEYSGATHNPEIATPERLMASVFRSELESYGGTRQTVVPIIDFPEYLPSVVVRGSDQLIQLKRANVHSKTYGTGR